MFFSLLSPLFLGLLFLMTESVRLQGDRARAVQITDMASFSLFGEYERAFLDQFDVFALDGGAGCGDFSLGRMEDTLKKYITANASVNSSGIRSLCFDPWQVHSPDVSITHYALLSDHDGEPFYQQAVAFMHQTAAARSLSVLLSHYRNAKKAEADRDAADLKDQQPEEQIRELEKSTDDAQELFASGENETFFPAPSVKNPIPAIKRLRRKKLTDIVCPGMKISAEKVGPFDLCSKRWGKRSGNWNMKKVCGGLVDDLLYREYLLDHFSCFGENAKSGRLQYQLEYIIAGKTGDKDNLVRTLKELLALREGCNYLCLLRSTGLSSQAEGLAFLLTGWLGIPELTALTKHVLMISWSYAESLMDVRILMGGGKIPLVKKEENWMIGLDSLSEINEILEKGGAGTEEGLAYRDFLRILLNLHPVRAQKKRGLDLAELSMRAEGFSQFRADFCIAGMKDKIRWTFRPVFGRVTSAFFGLGSGDGHMVTEGGYTYY